MKVIAQRIWTEPAAAIGLFTTVLLAVLNIATDNNWDVEHIVAIAAPLLSALGIRQTVSPAAGPRPPDTEPLPREERQPTTFQKSEEP